jgi:hypothetical protein
VPDTEDVLDIEERDLDGPAGRVAADDLRRCGGEVISAMSYPVVVRVLVVRPVSVTRMTLTVSVRHVPNHRHTRSAIFTVLVVP